MMHRSPILGFNHNVRHLGRIYHVQTEDSGVGNPHLFTHVFFAGTIIATQRTNYDASSSTEVVRGIMQRQHKAMLRSLKAGEFDGRIAQFFTARGEPVSLEPASAPQSEEGPPPEAVPSRPRASAPPASVEAPRAAIASAPEPVARSSALVSPDPDVTTPSLSFEREIRPTAPSPPTDRTERPTAPSLPTDRAGRPTAPSLPTDRAGRPTAPSLPTDRAGRPTAPSLPTDRAGRPTAPSLPTDRETRPTSPLLPTRAPAPPAASSSANVEDLGAILEPFASHGSEPVTVPVRPSDSVITPVPTEIEAGLLVMLGSDIPPPPPRSPETTGPTVVLGAAPPLPQAEPQRPGASQTFGRRIWAKKVGATEAVPSTPRFTPSPDGLMTPPPLSAPLEVRPAPAAPPVDDGPVIMLGPPTGPVEPARVSPSEATEKARHAPRPNPTVNPSASADGVVVARPAIVVGGGAPSRVATPSVPPASRPVAPSAPGRVAAPLPGVPAHPVAPQSSKPHPAREVTAPTQRSADSLFGKGLQNEKSLDEVILAYLAEEAKPPK